MRTEKPVKLKPKERRKLKQLMSRGTEKVRKITRGRILLTRVRQTDKKFFATQAIS